MRSITHRTRPIFTPLALCALFSAPLAQAQTVSIDFDHDAAGNLLNVTGYFNPVAAPSLTTAYASLGATFGGGGVILNRSKGAFPAPTHSGANYLVFQQGTYASGPETINFTNPVLNATIYASSPGTTAFTMTAYNSANTVVGISTGVSILGVTALGDYVFPFVKLSVTSNGVTGPIARVVLDRTPQDPFNVIFDYDDLSFSPAVTNALVSGVVTFQGISAQAVSQNVTFEFRPTDNSGIFTQTVSVAPSGAFTLAPVPRKTYTVHVKSAKYLASNITVNAASGNVTNAAVTLRPGDVVSDNMVDLSDFGGLVDVFGSSYNTADPNASARAIAGDLSGDGAINLADFGLLVNTFGLTGDL